MTSAQRRLLKRLIDQNDPAIESDREFFEQNPDRSYRVRFSSEAEVEINARFGGLPRIEGTWAYTAVRQCAPGVRTRSYALGTEPCGDGLPEDQARKVYEAATDPSKRVSTEAWVTRSREWGRA